MKKTKRIIEPIPQGITVVPTGTVTYDGMFDYLTEVPDVPEESIFVSEMQNNEVTVIKPPPPGFEFKHHFSGWDKVK